MTQQFRSLNRRSLIGTGLALAAVTATAIIPTPADAAIWAHIGTRTVNGLVDFDQIHVSPAYGTFDKIRLKVRGNSLMVYRVKIHYRNGAVQDVPIRFFIPQGGKTRIIDLNGQNRLIRKVTFTYGKFRNGRGRTFVDLIARK